MAATGLYSAAPGGSSSGPGAPGGPQTGNQQQNQVQTDYNRSRSPGRELDDHPAGNYYQGGQQVIILLAEGKRVHRRVHRVHVHPQFFWGEKH